MSVPLFARRTLSGERFFYASRPLRVRRFHPVQQPVRTGFQKLRQTRKRRHGEREAAPFNVPDGLNVDASQFSQAFLSQPGLEAGLTDVVPQHTQDFAVVHSP